MSRTWKRINLFVQYFASPMPKLKTKKVFVNEAVEFQ